jgi:hypothetical protein
MKTLLLLALTSSFTLAQGDLNPPPGGPTATMKTLAQIEARTPIPPSPAIPVSGLHFLILRPGSYYLTGNITVDSGDAIVINSDDVSIDLNGFTIRSSKTSGASGTAINVTGDRSRITIKNGSIVSDNVVSNGGLPPVMGFLYGIRSSTSINQAVISDVHVSGIARSGIEITSGGIIERCTATNCGQMGLVADIVRDCSALNCAVRGISANNVTNSTGEAVYGDGIVAKNATNCCGSSLNESGINAKNVTNCSGRSEAPAESTGAVGIRCGGTATYCQTAKPAGGFAGSAPIAIGCSTLSSGSWDSPSKHLGTP